MGNKSNIYDVARKAGVSPGTVSKVLNGHGGTTQTRKKVFHAAEELNYRPNLFASGMRSALKNCFGILVSKIVEDDPWLEKILPAMAKVFSDSDYRCMVDFWDETDDHLPRVLDNADGCVLLGSYPVDFFSRVERQYGLPLVTFAEKMPYGNGVSLNVDWQSGMQQIVQYLLAYQHKHIGLVVQGMRYASAKARYEAFLESMRHFGREVDESLIVTDADCEGADSSAGNHVSRIAGHLTEELLRRRPDVSAIIYNSDQAAFGGIATLLKSGRKIPEDVSVAGFDNTDVGLRMTPALTSAGFNYRQLSLRLLESLDALLGKRNIMPEKKLELELIKRESVAVASSD